MGQRVHRGEPAFLYEQLAREMDFDPSSWIGMFDAYVWSTNIPTPARYRGEAPPVVVTEADGKQVVLPFQTGSPRKEQPGWNRPTTATPAVLARRRVNGG